MAKTIHISDEKDLQLIFDVMKDAILLHPFVKGGGWGKLYMVNKTACERYGYTFEEFLTHSIEAISIETDLQESRRQFYFEKLENEGHVLFEMPHRTKDGQEIPVEINAGIVEIKGKKMILSVVRDISERKQTEKLREDSAKKIEAIFRVAPAGIGAVVNRHFTEVNDTFCQMTGYSQEELVGQSARMIYPTEEDFLKVGREKYKQIDEKGTGSLETRFLRKNGEIIHILMASTPLDINDYSKGVIFTAWDITTRKQQEEELRQHRNNLEQLVQKRTEQIKKANKELIEQNRIIKKQKEELERNFHLLKEKESQLIHAEKMASLGILTAGVAHEINNPLNYIMGGYTGLENFFKEKEIDFEEVELLLRNIKLGIDKVASIVKGLNQFSRDKETFEEVCNIHEIIDNCLLILNNQLKNKIHIEKSYSNECNIIFGNVGKLHQAFLNILTNACQAIKKEGIISIVTQKDKNWLKVNIIDNGIGMKKHTLSKITDPFFTTKEPGEGTGLGLSITYSIIKKHKGELEFESEFNIGTTAIIKLPFIKNDYVKN